MGKTINRLRADRDVPTHDTVSVDIVIPVYNEERALPVSIPSLCRYLESYIPYQWSVTIADNASTDRTMDVANDLAAADPRVKVLHLEQKGRGRALKAAWLASEADIWPDRGSQRQHCPRWRARLRDVGSERRHRALWGARRGSPI